MEISIPTISKEPSHEWLVNTDFLNQKILVDYEKVANQEVSTFVLLEDGDELDEEWTNLL